MIDKLTEGIKALELYFNNVEEYTGEYSLAVAAFERLKQVIKMGLKEVEV